MNEYEMGKLGVFDREGSGIITQVIEYSMKRGVSVSEILPIVKQLGKLWNHSKEASKE